MSIEYKRVRGQGINGQWWTNVRYVDGVCEGGDRHWLTPELADASLLRQMSADLRGTDHREVVQ